VRNGIYRFTWHGLDRKGNWQKIKEGTFEVTGVPDEDAQADTPA
jgi:hypothetical protein